MSLRPLGETRVSVDLGDGWQELAGVTRIAIDEQHQPIDGWPNVDAWIRAQQRLALAARLRRQREVHDALAILRPHLDREPLYVV